MSEIPLHMSRKINMCVIKKGSKSSFQDHYLQRVVPYIKWWCNEQALRDKIYSLIAPYIRHPYIYPVLDFNWVRVKPYTFTVWSAPVVPVFVVFPSSSSGFPLTIVDYVIEQMVHFAIFKRPIAIAPFLAKYFYTSRCLRTWYYCYQCKLKNAIFLYSANEWLFGE